jgi:hypothetical protein
MKVDGELERMRKKIIEREIEKKREKERKGESYLERAHECVIHAHHGPCIVELPTVIGCTKDGD